jgi:hypothetical protein
MAAGGSMVDVAAALLTAGLSLSQKLVMSWVEHGRSRVKVSEVESSIAKESVLEAERLRVRVDDLERAAQQMMREIVARTPQMSYSRPRLGPAVLDMQFDPHNPASSKQMLSDLRLRIAEISASVAQPTAEGEPPALPKVTIDPDPAEDSVGQDGVGERRRSAEMIEELRGRVREAEGPRK